MWAKTGRKCASISFLLFFCAPLVCKISWVYIQIDAKRYELFCSQISLPAFVIQACVKRLVIQPCLSCHFGKIKPLFLHVRSYSSCNFHLSHLLYSSVWKRCSPYFPLVLSSLHSYNVPTGSSQSRVRKKGVT